MPGTVLRVKNLIFTDQHGFDIKSPASHKSNRELLLKGGVFSGESKLAVSGVYYPIQFS